MQAINAVFLGDYAKARQVVRNSEDIVSKTDAPNFWRGHHLNVAKALLAVHDNDRDAFNRYAENTVSESLRIGECYDFYRAACWLAPYYARLGYQDKALSLLQDSITKTSMIGNAYGEARSCLLLESISYYQGNLAVTRSHLGDSLSLCLAGDGDFLFLYKEKVDAAKLLPFALSEKLSIPFVSRLSQGFKAECAGSVTGLLRHKDPEVWKAAVGVLSGMEYREAEREIVGLLEDTSPAVRECAGEAVRRLISLPPVPLRVYTLGEFRLSVGDRDIPASAWKRRTAKSILKYLKFRNGQYHLKLPEGSFVDAVAFECICNNAFSAKREGSLEYAISCCKSAIDLYSNDFLVEDVYEEWTAPLRAKYSDMYVRVLKETSRYHFNQFEYDICIEMLNKILERDPWDEDAYLLLMKSYLAMGNRSLAIKAYKRCDKMLRKELGTGTCDALSDLFRMLLKFR
ncbi:MAG: pknK [Candidatus Brocadiaceae bacterium]|nr:pknK [Candidatus Brocadiaceae bacterium]